MGKQTMKCTYKPDTMDPHSTDEFIVLVADRKMLEDWRAEIKEQNSSSIPLVEIVDAFEVFHTGQGSQGILERPKDAVLDSAFGTAKIEEVIKKILLEGSVKASDGMEGGKWTGTKDGQYSAGQSKGSMQGNQGRGGR